MVYASGVIYTAGSYEDPFDDRYPVVEWVGANVLGLRHEPGRYAGRLPSYETTVTNEGTRPVRWLTVKAADLHLILQLPPQQKVAFSSLWWEIPASWFVVNGKQARTSIT